MSAFNIGVNAHNNYVSNLPRVTFGVEWSYLCTFYSAYHYNYFSTDGYRVNRRGGDSGWANNGEANLHIGYNFNENWNLSFHAGLTGLMNIHNAVPLSLRATHYFGKDHLTDRWFAFFDAGTGISIKTEPQELVSGKIGGGYRISLSRDTKLDIIAGFRITHTHPTIVDEGTEITLKWINRNSALLTAFSVGISLTL